MDIGSIICEWFLSYVIGVIVVAVLGSIATRRILVISVFGITITLTGGAVAAFFIKNWLGLRC